MRKLAIVTVGTAALVLSGILAWTADATTLTSAAAVHPEANSSLVGKAGCWLPGLPGECEIGQQKVCNRFGNRCHCAPCPGWYPWPEISPRIKDRHFTCGIKGRRLLRPTASAHQV